MKHSFRNMIFSGGRDDAVKEKQNNGSSEDFKNVYETVPRFRVTIFVDEA
jgi:hypothetical protein